MTRRRYPLAAIMMAMLFIIQACAPAEKTEVDPALAEDASAPVQESPAAGENPQTEESAAGFMAEGEADVIFTNGVVLTMDEGNPQAEAVAVQGNIIMAVGSAEDVGTLAGENTQVIDLGGLTMMPGFIDPHQHMFDDAIINGYDVAENQKFAISQGITTAADMFVTGDILNAMMAMADAGEIRLRMHAYLVYKNNCGDDEGDWWREYAQGQILSERLRVGGLKIFTDGGSCNIPAMSVEYPAGGQGDLYFDQAEMDAILRTVDEAGYQAAIHALGDASLEVVMNSFDNVLGGENPNRHRIEHNATVRPDMIGRYEDLGAAVTIFGSFPTCIHTSGQSNFKYILPQEFREWDWPWRAMVDQNPSLRPAWHSDFPVFGTMSPFYHMWGMVTRKAYGFEGQLCEPPDFLAVNRLRIEEVLPMMTINGAYALHREDEMGSLTAGKLADMVILSENPLTVEADALQDIGVLMTMIDGAMEYCADEGLCPEGSEPAETGTEIAEDAAGGEGYPRITTTGNLPPDPGENAFDEWRDTMWNAGKGPVQWIQYDFGSPQTIRGMELLNAQEPEGETVHEIWMGPSEDELVLVKTFSGFTTDWGEFEFVPDAPVTNVRVVRVVTTVHPGWVAWRDIQIITE